MEAKRRFLLPGVVACALLATTAVPAVGLPQSEEGLAPSSVPVAGLPQMGDVPDPSAAELAALDGLSEEYKESILFMAATSDETVEKIANDIRTELLLQEEIDPVIEKYRDSFSQAIIGDDGVATIHFKGEVPSEFLDRWGDNPRVVFLGGAALTATESDELNEKVFRQVAQSVENNVSAMSVVDPVDGRVEVAVSEPLTQGGVAKAKTVVQEANADIASELGISPSTFSTHKEALDLDIVVDKTLTSLTQAINGSDAMTSSTR